MQCTVIGSEAIVLHHKVLYICVSCWLLAHKSRDLSQAETKITTYCKKLKKLTKLFHTQNEHRSRAPKVVVFYSFFIPCFFYACFKFGFKIIGQQYTSTTVSWVLHPRITTYIRQHKWRRYMTFCSSPIYFSPCSFSFGDLKEQICSNCFIRHI